VQKAGLQAVRIEIPDIRCLHTPDGKGRVCSACDSKMVRAKTVNVSSVRGMVDEAEAARAKENAVDEERVEHLAVAFVRRYYEAQGSRSRMFPVRAENMRV